MHKQFLVHAIDGSRKAGNLQQSHNFFSINFTVGF